MASLPGQYTGFHHYSYNKSKYPCLGEDCKNVPGSHKNNYFLCKSCTTVKWFENYIMYFRLDDVGRADAQERLSLKEAIPIHREVKKLHKEFKKRGGQIHLLGNPKDLPKLTWNTGKTKFVIHAEYPKHLKTNVII